MHSLREGSLVDVPVGVALRRAALCTILYPAGGAYGVTSILLNSLSFSEPLTSDGSSGTRTTLNSSYRSMN